MSKNVVLINPNPCGSQIVPTEDLNIGVELRTIQRSKSVLNANKGVATNTKSGTIKFIDGPTIDGKKSLTTSYTNITTVFGNNENQLEGLGITNIDISFNTSYAPLITIDFVDVRGSSLLGLGNQSKFNVFFELPYPIFELSVKGYYGKTVTYCLHMVKWNANFDDQTGSFKIKANFIGYTYGVLPDILIGYMRAVTETKTGLELYKNKYPNLLTINELFTEVELIENQVTNLKNDNLSVKRLSFTTKTIDLYRSVKDKLIKLNIILEGYGVLEGSKDEFIIIKENSEAKNFKKIIKEFNTEKSNIRDFIKNDINSLVPSNFKFDLNKITKLNYVSSKKDERFDDEEIKEIYDDIIGNNEVSDNQRLAYFNLIPIYDELDNKIKLLGAEQKKQKIDIDSEIKKILEDESTFNPTIKNIFDILIGHADILIEVIKQTAIDAEKSESRKRKLGKFYGKEEVLPFPQYFKKNDKNVNEESWIGEDFPRIPEVKLVEDIIEAIISNKTKDNILDVITENNDQIHVPINPLDTELFGGKNPYSIIRNSLKKDDIIRLVCYRAITYLGHTIDNPSNLEIETMAKLEANNLFNNLINSDIRNTVIYRLNGLTKENDIFNEILKIVSEPNDKLSLDNGNKQLLTKDGRRVLYGGKPYITTTDDLNYLPISTNLIDNTTTEINKNTSFYDGSTIVNKSSQELSDSGIFIGEYYNNNNFDNPKLDDGSTYIKIFTDSQYSTNKISPNYSDDIIDSSLIENIVNEDVIGELSVDSFTKGESGWPTFGGSFNITEFSTVNDDDLGEVPNYLLYYNNTNTVIKKSILTTNRTSKTKWDINNDNISKIERSTKASLNKERDFIGKERVLISKINSNFNDVGTPNINFSNYNISLFGSKFYNTQDTDFSKALLFLHTLPFNGLVNNKDGLFGGNPDGQDFVPITITLPLGGVLNFSYVKDDNGRLPEISGQFDKRAGFINAPYSWILFVGGLLWRSKENVEPINFQFFPGIESNTPLPNKNQYLKRLDSVEALNVGGLGTIEYLPIENVILQLPEQVKTEFINEFKNWVNSTSRTNYIGWQTLKNSLEIFNSNINNIEFDSIYDGFELNHSSQYLRNNTVIKDSIFNSYKVFINDKPLFFTPIEEKKPTFKNFYLEISDQSEINRFIKKFLISNKWISNSTFRIWKYTITDKPNNKLPISTSNIRFKTYLQSFISEYKKLVEDSGTFTEEEKVENEVFNTLDNKDIKLNVYRTIKSIYDKWVGGTSDNTVFELCGVNPTNFGANLKDSFKYLDRAYNNIGQKVKLNPFNITSLLKSNYNQSFYDLISRVLSSNNFDFIPLPNFINYNNEENLQSIFKPFPYSKVLETGKKGSIKGDGGPTFLCVYAGQNSTNLDLKNSEDDNDGVDFEFSESKCRDILTTPDNIANFSDFTDDKDTDYNNIPVFVVNYGKQNQSIFKSINLDQSEFSETDETLRITNDISLKGSQTNRTLGGQNLYNIFSKRSYSVEIECMGNPMIQPMMYFQLNGIPLFHGGYRIIKVTHSLTPNNMKTKFKGVRINKIATPIIEDTTVYMNLIGSLDNVDVEGASLDSTKISETNTNPNISASGVRNDFIPAVNIFNDNNKKGDYKNKKKVRIIEI